MVLEVQVKNRKSVSGRVAHDLRQKISNGIYRPGALLPGRRALANSYRVANVTIDQSIKMLMSEGLLRTEHGRGTFVSEGVEGDAEPSRRRTASSNTVQSLRLGLSLRDVRAMSDSDSYLAHIVHGVRLALAPYGIRHSITFVEDQDLDQIPQSSRSELAGLLFASPDIDKRTRIDHLWRSGIPVVVVGSSWMGIQAPFVDCDNTAGMNSALDLLIARGHRDIACAVVIVNSCHHYDRKQAFLKHMSERGVAPRPENVIELWRPSNVQTADELRKLFSQPSRPTALIALDPLFAVLAVKVLREMNLRVPDDVSIVGFDDTILARNNEPPITTVGAPFEEMGELAMKTLIGLCEGKPLMQPQDLMPMLLTERGSVGPRPAG